MQSVSSRIWTRVAVIISYDDNHYTTGTFSACYAKTEVSIALKLFFLSCYVMTWCIFLVGIELIIFYT